jgi:hypothetical protein
MGAGRAHGELCNSQQGYSPPGEGETLAASGHEPTSGEEVNTGSILKNRGKSDQIKVNQTKPAKPGLPSETTKGKPGVTIKVEGSGFKIEGSKSDEGPPDQNMPPLNRA